MLTCGRAKLKKAASCNASAPGSLHISISIAEQAVVNRAFIASMASQAMQRLWRARDTQQMLEAPPAAKSDLSTAPSDQGKHERAVLTKLAEESEGACSSDGSNMHPIMGQREAEQRLNESRTAWMQETSTRVGGHFVSTNCVIRSLL